LFEFVTPTGSLQLRPWWPPELTSERAHRPWSISLLVATLGPIWPSATVGLESAAEAAPAAVASDLQS